MIRGRRLHAVATLGVLCLAAASMVTTAHAQGGPVGGQTAMAHTAAIEHLPLVGVDGAATSLGALMRRHGTIVLSLTYTGCQAICPTSDLIMNALEEATAQTAEAVGLVTLSIDPFNDTLDALRRHAAAIGAAPRRHWLTGSPQNVFAVLDGLGVSFGNREDHPPAFFIAAPGKRTLLRVDGLPAPSVLLEAARSARSAP